MEGLFTKQGVIYSGTDVLFTDKNKPYFLEARHCPKCGGLGRIAAYHYHDGGICYDCHGTGGHHKAPVKLYTEVQVSRIKELARLRAEKAAELKEEARASFMKEYGAWIENALSMAKAGKDIEGSCLISGIIETAKETCYLTKKQIETVDLIASRIRARLCGTASKSDAPNGRQKVIGTIKTIKAVDSAYGRTWKMLVELDTSATVWGTVPQKVWDTLPFDCMVGKEIEFEADFTCSENDKTHSFFKRPSKVKVLEAAAV